MSDALGVEKIASCQEDGILLCHHDKVNNIVAAICVGSIALATHLHDANENICEHEITCNPGIARSLEEKLKSIKLDEIVVDSKINNCHLVTTQGPATVIQCTLKILSHLTNECVPKETRKAFLLNISSSCYFS